MNNTYKTAFNTIRNTIETWNTKAKLAANNPSNAQFNALEVLNTLTNLVRDLQPANCISSHNLLTEICQNISTEEYSIRINFADAPDTNIPIASLGEIYVNVGWDNEGEYCVEVSMLTEDNQCVKEAVILGYVFFDNEFNSEFDMGFTMHTLCNDILSASKKALESHCLDCTEDDSEQIDVSALMNKALSILRRKFNIAPLFVKYEPIPNVRVNAEDLRSCDATLVTFDSAHPISKYLPNEVKETLADEDVAICILGGKNIDSYTVEGIVIGALRVINFCPDCTRKLISDNFGMCLMMAIDEFMGA